MGAVGADEGVALAALDAADGQFVLVAELQAEFLGELLDRSLGRAWLLAARFGFPAGFRPLAERFGQRHGRIGGSGPRSLEILLIHHGL